MEGRLHEAALRGNVSSLIELLHEDALILDRVIVDCVVETPLHIAAMRGHVDFTRAILSHTPELVGEIYWRRSSPLHLASAKGYVEIVKQLLLIKPAMCLARDRDEKIPLHRAAMNGHVTVLEELVRAKPKTTRVRADRDQTILHLCVKYNHLDALRMLVDPNADDEFDNWKDYEGNNILHLAVADKKIETINFLLSNTGVRINELNADGFTALDILAHSPRDLKDMDIGDSLQGAGALRARDIPLAAHNTGVISPRNRFLVTRNQVSAQSPPSQESIPAKHVKNPGELLKRKRSSLMVVASLIANMAFQVGVTPPGGLWQEDSPIHSKNKHRHVAGMSTMADKYPEDYYTFVRYNLLGFYSSLSIILLLASGLPSKNRLFMWILMVILWVMVGSMAITLCYSILILTPYSAHERFYNEVQYATITWIVLMVLLLLWYTGRLIVKGIRMGKLKRRGRGTSHSTMELHRR